MLTNRWNPFDELATLHHDMDRVFGRHWRDPAPESTTGTWMPQSEMVSHDDGWQLRLALPGVDPKAVAITLHGNTLRVSGERPVEGNEQGDVYRSELPHGPFERTFALPSNVDGDNVEASFRHGMLYLTVPIAESAKPRRIEISGGELKDIEAKRLA